MKLFAPLALIFLIYQWSSDDLWMKGGTRLLCAFVLHQLWRWVVLKRFFGRGNPDGSLTTLSISFSPEQIAWEFAAGRAECSWVLVSSLFVSPELWVLNLQGGSPLYLPLEQLPFDCRRLILDRVHAVRARIIEAEGARVMEQLKAID